MAPSLRELARRAKQQAHHAKHLSYEHDFNRSEPLRKKRAELHQRGLLRVAVASLLALLAGWGLFNILVGLAVAVAVGFVGWISHERWLDRELRAAFEASRHELSVGEAQPFGLTPGVGEALDALPEAFLSASPNEPRWVTLTRESVADLIAAFTALQHAVAHQEDAPWQRDERELMAIAERTTIFAIRRAGASEALFAATGADPTLADAVAGRIAQIAQQLHATASAALRCAGAQDAREGEQVKEQLRKLEASVSAWSSLA